MACKVAIVSGSRTPFVKAGTVFSNYTMQQLGQHVLKSLVEKSKIDPKKIDEFVFGAVLLDPRTPNWAREILFSAGLPKNIYAQSVSNNCISGLVAITNVSERIALGKSHIGIAGGVESMSNPTLIFGKKATDVFLNLFRARDLKEKLALALKLRPGYFLPNPPAVTEPSTGLTMGQHMEHTAKELEIKREIQDEIAYLSHKNAAEAQASGVFKDEIASLNGIDKDLLIRADTSIDKLKKLKPVFDRSDKGTITAGNASALTDGASAVLLMSEDAAKNNGMEPIAFIKDYEYSAIDPNDGLLMAPVVAVNKLLKRNNLKFSDFDLFEVHEAFGAQVAANIKGWEQGWKGMASIGAFDRAKMNVNGGSIAIGHPFSATGGRLVYSLANELKRRNAKRGLISICAAGAMAGAMIIERS